VNIVGFDGSVEWEMGNSTSLNSGVGVKGVGFLIIVINEDNQYELRSKHSQLECKCWT